MSETLRTVILPDGSPLEYTLVRGGVKNINLRVRTDGTVRVSTPARVPVGTADGIVLGRAEFIRSAREELRRREERRPSPERRIPEAECRAAIRAAVDAVYPAFRSMGVPYPELRFRDMKTRWGVCRYRDGIVTFNTRLAYAPRECIEYVAAHELCHFIHPDHSARFHALMASVMPDYRERKRRLSESAAAWL